MDGKVWQFDNVLYVYAATLPDGFKTPIYNAAATWNAAGKFKMYHDVSASHYWNYSNYGSIGGIVASTYAPSHNGILYMANTDFNSYYSFSYSGTPSSSQYDAQSVALHEFGHWLQLLDLTSGSSAPVMWHSIGRGVVKRTLTSDDINGDKYLYP